MEDVNLIALAIPVFLVMILMEFVASKAMDRDVYRFDDAVTDLACGIGSEAVGVFLKLFGLLTYIWVFNNLSLPALLGTPEIGGLAGFVFAMIANDFIYYWWHRAGHRWNIMWAAHIVHHQSQDYNLAVALRQAWFTKLTSPPFHWPLAFLGVPPLLFFMSDALNTLYQFWIHTRLVGKLGPIEWVMNTPSHHRVHHGINPEYIDKNYAGILIIWDRMFGTFEEEQAEVVYGTVTPFKHWDGVWANFDYLATMWQIAKTAPTAGSKLWTIFAPPEWRPDGNKTIPPVDAATFEKWETDAPTSTRVWVGINFLPVVGAVTALLLLEKTVNFFDLGVLVVLVVATMIGWAALLHRKEWAVQFEAMRLVWIAAAVVVYL